MSAMQECKLLIAPRNNKQILKKQELNIDIKEKSSNHRLLDDLKNAIGCQ
jgi:hypothetical protein